MDYELGTALAGACCGLGFAVVAYNIGSYNDAAIDMGPKGTKGAATTPSEASKKEVAKVGGGGFRR